MQKKHPQQESIDMIRKIIHIDEEKSVSTTCATRMSSPRQKNL